MSATAFPTSNHRQQSLTVPDGRAISGPVNGKKGGAPTKFTDTVRKRLVNCVSKGMPHIHAARAAGISSTTFQNWRRAYPDFDEEIEQAISASMERLLDIVEKAAKVDASKATWLLEHRWPELFARNRLELTGANGAPIAGAVALFLPQKDGTPAPPPPVVVTDTEVVNNNES